MKPILLFGTTIVNLALISYSIALITEQRKRLASNFVLTFLTIGVVLDVTATTCMIIGSSHTAFTVHGMLGYSALTLMLIDCFLLWKHKNTNGTQVQINKKLHMFSRVTYIWWVLAYITGAIIVAIRHIH